MIVLYSTFFAVNLTLAAGEAPPTRIKAQNHLPAGS